MGGTTRRYSAFPEGYEPAKVWEYKPQGGTWGSLNKPTAGEEPGTPSNAATILFLCFLSSLPSNLSHFSFPDLFLLFVLPFSFHYFQIFSLLFVGEKST